MATKQLEASVAAHYGKPGLMEAIMAGLNRLGVDPEKPEVEDLAPVDEFHTAGRKATLKAFEMMSFEPGMHVLDGHHLEGF